MSVIILRWVAGAAILALPCVVVVPALAQEATYTGSVQFATGKYLFDSRTESVYVLSGVDFTAGPVRLTASIPVIVQTTPWISYGVVPVPSGGRQAGEVGRQSGRGQRRIILPVTETGFGTQAGIGDPLVHADVEVLHDGPGTPSVRLGAGVKLPIASVDDGFSTGEWDYGAGVSVFKAVGMHSVSADIAYWRFGDMEGLPLKDAWSYSAAYGRALAGGRWSLVMSTSGYSTIIDGQDPPVLLGIGLGRTFSPRRALTGMVSFGLTDTAPDVSVGIGWRLGL